MKFAEIKAIAKEMGIKVVGVKKADMVREIQVREGNEPCFATGRVSDCGQPHCLWFEACES
jgi:hypothetical protein